MVSEKLAYAIKDYLKFDNDAARWNAFEYKDGDEYVNAEYIGEHKDKGKYIIRVNGELLIVKKEDLRMKVVKTFQFRNYVSFESFGSKAITIHTYFKGSEYSEDDLKKGAFFIQWAGDWQEVTVDLISLLTETQ